MLGDLIAIPSAVQHGGEHANRLGHAGVIDLTAAAQARLFGLDGALPVPLNELQRVGVQLRQTKEGRLLVVAEAIRGPPAVELRLLRRDGPTTGGQWKPTVTRQLLQFRLTAPVRTPREMFDPEHTLSRPGELVRLQFANLVRLEFYSR